MVNINIKSELLKYLANKKISALSIVSLLTSVDILFLKTFFWTISLLIFSIWISIILFYKFQEKQVAVIILALFVIIAFSHVFNIISVVEKSAIWVYLFLMIYLYLLIKADKDPN